MTSTSSEPPCTLHHLNHSQSLRVLWCLEELSPLPYNLELYSRIKARAPPELKAIHPLGKSPVLTIEPVAGSSSTKKITIAESRLIIQYIADHYSKGAWTPKTADEKFEDDYWVEFANSTLGPTVAIGMVFDMMPAQSPFLMRPVMNLISMGAVSMIVKELTRPYQLMEEALTQHPWFSGESIGVADFNMSWPMDLSSQRGFFDETKYPKIAEWLNRVHERPAYKRALEKSGGYDLKMFG